MTKSPSPIASRRDTRESVSLRHRTNGKPGEIELTRDLAQADADKTANKAAREDEGYPAIF